MSLLLRATTTTGSAPREAQHEPVPPEIPSIPLPPDRARPEEWPGWREPPLEPGREPHPARPAMPEVEPPAREPRVPPDETRGAR